MLYQLSQDPSTNLTPDTARLPALSALLQQLMSSVSSSVGVQPLSGFASAFAAVLRSNEAVVLLNRDLERIAAEPRYISSTFSTREYILFRDNYHVLSLYLSRPRLSRRNLGEAAFVETMPSSFMIGVQGSRAPVQCTAYKFDPPVKSNVFDPNAALIKRGTVTLEERGALFECYPMEIAKLECGGDTAFLKLMDTRVTDCVWSVDARTYRPLFMSASHPSITRFETQIQLILLDFDRYGSNKQSLQLLTELTHSPYHFIRWKAIQALYIIDRDSAIARLRAAVNDPHPQIARAARQALAVRQTPRVA